MSDVPEPRPIAEVNQDALFELLKASQHTSPELASLYQEMNEVLYPPVPLAVVDVPALLVEGVISPTAIVGQLLTCTQGNWDGEPTRKAYQWYRSVEGAEPMPVGDGSPSYRVAQSDKGVKLACVVTAFNSLGELKADPSNEVLIET